MTRLVLVLVAVLSLTSCQDDEPRPVSPPQPGSETANATATGDCAAGLVFGGHEYVGYGDLHRDPETTGRVETGLVPGCGDEPHEKIEVAELADLPMARAVLALGTVYLREDRPFPEQIRPWFQRPRCAGDETFEVSGVWLGVTGPNRVRFDGDLRPPYRLEVHLDAPDRLRGGTVWLLVDRSTTPTLGPDDVRTSLWEGGGVVAWVRCDGRDFIVKGVRSTPG